MNAPSLKLLIAGGLLALNLAAQAAPSYESAQDADHPLACCLASEWALSAPTNNPGSAQPQGTQSAARHGTHSAPGQTELGDLSCCIGAEWVLDQAKPTGSSGVVESAPATASEEFCCLASEYFAQ